MAFIENPNAVAKPLDPTYTVGRVFRTVQAKIEVTAETADNDVVILAKGITPTARIARIFCVKTALTDASIDIGLYRETNGSYEAVSEGVIADGATLTAGSDIVGANIASFDTTAYLANLAGANAGEFPDTGYVIGAKLVNKGSDNGVAELDVLIEQA